MEIKNFTYLLLLLAHLIIPVVLSLQKKVHFVFQLRYLLPAIIFTGAIFIIWDIRFAELEIWFFNPNYLLGIDLLKLPVEEWISFVIVPLSSVYIYEYVKIRLKSFEKPNLLVAFSLLLLLLFGILTYFYRVKLFAFFTFFLLTIYCAYTIFRNRFKRHYTKFYLTFLITLFPYVIFKGLLIRFTVVGYNTDHIIGIRLFAIPLENFGYLFLMLLMTITIYEYLKERQFY